MLRITGWDTLLSAHLADSVSIDLLVGYWPGLLAIQDAVPGDRNPIGHPPGLFYHPGGQTGERWGRMEFAPEHGQSQAPEAPPPSPTDPSSSSPTPPHQPPPTCTTPP